jgi:hypothetical protein
MASKGITLRLRGYWVSSSERADYYPGCANREIKERHKLLWHIYMSCDRNGQKYPAFGSTQAPLSASFKHTHRLRKNARSQAATNPMLTFSHWSETGWKGRTVNLGLW